MTAAGTMPQVASGFEVLVKRQAGWRRNLLAALAGSLSVLAFAPFYASPVLFFTFPVLVWLIDASPTARAAAVAGWWFAFGYFFFNLFWLGEAFLVEADKFAVLLPFAVTLLPAGLALFWALAAAVARRFWAPGFVRVIVLALALSLVEWLRGHVLTGLPWNLPGYALTYPLELMQSASIAGVYALTLPAVVIACAPLVLWFDEPGMAFGRRLARAIASAAIPLALMWTYGAVRLAEPQAFVPGVTLRLVQPSVPQREKWMAEYQSRFFQQHLAMSRQNPQGQFDDLQGVTHIIWPESAMPFFPLEEPRAMQALSNLLIAGQVLIAGGPRHESEADATLPFALRKAYTSLMAFGRDGKIAVYDKIHLVPFGEYIPFPGVLDALGLMSLAHGHGSFAAGVTPRPVLAVPGLPPVLGLICYEALFPGALVEGAERPGVMINLTNDGWFGDTTGPRQHFHQSRVRAVEEGLPLVRSANNGISAVVDGHGRILTSLALDVQGVTDSRLPAALPPTLYSRLGDYPFLIVVFFAAAIAAKQISWRI